MIERIDVSPIKPTRTCIEKMLACDSNIPCELKNPGSSTKRISMGQEPLMELSSARVILRAYASYVLQVSGVQEIVAEDLTNCQTGKTGPSMC